MSCCRETYCINHDFQPNDIVDIGVKAGGFVLASGYSGTTPLFDNDPTPATREQFRVPRAATVRFTDLTNEAHTIVADDDSWTINLTALGTATIIAGITLTLGESDFGCNAHIDSGEQIKQGRLVVFHPGAMDIHQDDATTSRAGCCRASISATLKHYYTGFRDFSDAMYPRYRTFTRTTTFDGFAFPPLGMYRRGYWQSVLYESGEESFAGATETRRVRFRHSRYVVRGREEAQVTDGSLWNSYVYGAGSPSLGARSEQWLEVDIADDPEELTLYVRTYSTAPYGDWNYVNDQKRTRSIRWVWTDSRDGDTIVYTGPDAGTVVEEFTNPYDWADFITDCNALLTDWGDVEYPYVALRVGWFDGEMTTGAVGDEDPAVAPFDAREDNARLTSGACEITRQTFDLIAFTPYADVADEGNWPPPPYTDGGDWTNGGAQDFGQLPSYQCVFTEPIGNSLLGNYPANKSDDPNTDPAPVTELTEEMFQESTEPNQYHNECATSNFNGEAINSPPVHLMAQVRMWVPSHGGFIGVERTLVKRWWSAPFCRRVWEDKGTPELKFCEYSAGDFQGTNLVPSGATYDANGEYIATDLFNTDVCYKWTPGANDNELVQDNGGADEFTATTEVAFKAIGEILLRGTPNLPVTAEIRGDNVLAPCARIDDPAHSNSMVDPATAGEIPSTWTEIADWHTTIAAGQEWIRFSEMYCPDHLAPSLPPCGCPP